MGANCLTHLSEPPHDRQLSTIKKVLVLSFRFFFLPLLLRAAFCIWKSVTKPGKHVPLFTYPIVCGCALLLWGGAGPPRPEGTRHLSCGHSCSLHRTHCSVISSRAGMATSPVGTLVAIETCWCWIWLYRQLSDIGVVLSNFWSL